MSNVSSLPSVQDARDRALRYWGSDGFDAMITGLATLLLGLGLFWSHGHTGLREFLGDLVGLLASIFMAEEATVGKVVGSLKARITYPRTGYIAPPLTPSPPDITLLSPAEQEQLRKEKNYERWIWGPMVLAFLGASFGGRNLIVDAVLAIAFFWMAFLLWRSRSAGQPRWRPLLVFAFYAALLAFLPGGLAERTAMSLVAVGAFSTIAGTVTFILYLHQHPEPQAASIESAHD